MESNPCTDRFLPPMYMSKNSKLDVPLVPGYLWQYRNNSFGSTETEKPWNDDSYDSTWNDDSYDSPWNDDSNYKSDDDMAQLQNFTNSMHPQVYRALTNRDIAVFERLYSPTAGQNDLEDGLQLCPKQISEQLSPHEDTILHIAARSGKDSLVCLIFEQGHGLQLSKQKNKAGNLPLHEAAIAGHLSIVQILLSLPTLSVNESTTSLAPEDTSTIRFAREILRERNIDGNSALHLALGHRHEEVARFLLGKDSEVAHHLNRNGICPLHMAAEAGYVELFKNMMMKLFKDEDILEVNEVHKFTLVRVVIDAKNNGILRTVLSQWSGFIESVDDCKQMRPLSLAAFTGYLDGVRQILDKSSKAAYLAEIDGLYPIHLASIKGHVEILAEFLKRCPDSRELQDKNYRNILHLAALNGRAKAVSYILKNCDLEMLINARDSTGNTPLHLAAQTAHPKVVSILTWNSKVKLELLTNRKMTALDLVEDYNGKYSRAPSFRERLTWQALRYAGARRSPKETRIRMDQNPIPYAAQNLNFYKDRVNTLMLVSILVVTITFAAGFIYPGNFDTSGSKVGTITLFEKCIFNIFVVSNTIAFYAAITVVVALIWSQLGDLRLVLASLSYTVPVLGLSLATVSVAFMTGVCLVVKENTKLAIFVLVMGSIGFLILFALFAPLYSPSSLKHRLARQICYYPFYLLIKVSKSDDTDHNCEVNEVIQNP